MKKKASELVPGDVVYCQPRDGGKLLPRSKANGHSFRVKGCGPNEERPGYINLCRACDGWHYEVHGDVEFEINENPTKLNII